MWSPCKPPSSTVLVLLLKSGVVLFIEPKRSRGDHFEEFRLVLQRFCCCVLHSKGTAPAAALPAAGGSMEQSQAQPWLW